MMIFPKAPSCFLKKIMLKMKLSLTLGRWSNVEENTLNASLPTSQAQHLLITDVEAKGK